jgi:RNA polymerase sigma-70 factor (ECF subfamily)
MGPSNGRSSLAAAAAGGDPSATAALLESVWPDAFRIAWSILGERTSAEDAAQEACARVLTSIASLRDPESFAAWFYRIVVNESRQRIRGAARNAPLVEDVRVDEAFSLEDHLDLRRALQALDPALRAVVVLRYYAGLNSTQIATVVGASSMTVRWRLFIARRRLQRSLGAQIQSHNAQTNRTGELTDEPQAVR